MGTCQESSCARNAAPAPSKAHAHLTAGNHREIRELRELELCPASVWDGTYPGTERRRRRRNFSGWSFRQISAFWASSSVGRSLRARSRLPGLVGPLSLLRLPGIILQAVPPNHLDLYLYLPSTPLRHCTCPFSLLSLSILLVFCALPLLSQNSILLLQRHSFDWIARRRRDGCSFEPCSSRSHSPLVAIATTPLLHGLEFPTPI